MQFDKQKILANVETFASNIKHAMITNEDISWDFYQHFDMGLYESNIGLVAETVKTFEELRIK